MSPAEPETPLSPVRVESHGADEDDADENVLVKRVYVDDLKAIVDFRKEDGPQRAAGDRATATEQGCPADDDGGNGLEGEASPAAFGDAVLRRAAPRMPASTLTPPLIA